MAEAARRKWRPSLAMIVFVVLATVAALPLIGLFFFRLYENQLIRQTESELIAETAMLAVMFKAEVEHSPQARARLKRLRRPSEPTPAQDEPFQPIEPKLDLAAGEILGRRPEAIDAKAPPDRALSEIGARLEAIALEAQTVTLAGFRFLDADGTVIGGREEVGRSLAQIDEVATALGGQYGSALRLRVLTSEPPPLYSISRGTGVRVFVAMPVIVDQALAGVIYASRTPNNVVKHLYGERGKVALAAASVVAVTLLIGLLFWRTIARPIRALIGETRRIGSGAKAEPLRQHGTREIAMLSESFVDMAGRLSERSDYIRTFAAHVSHELKSPLTSIQGAAELLQDADASPEPMSEAERRHFLRNIIDDTRRLTVLLDRLRELARADNPQKGGDTTLRVILPALAAGFSALEITAEGDQDLAFAMSPENAVIVFSHLLDNAARHDGRHVRILVASEGGRARIDIADDGDGISPANQAKVFEPFFTTRRESGGTGMGLGIVQSMLRSHGGTIRLISSTQGTCFRITIPLAPGSGA